MSLGAAYPVAGFIGIDLPDILLFIIWLCCYGGENYAPLPADVL